MKRRRHRYKLIALFLFACFLGTGIWGVWSVRHYGTRWFAHASNTRLTAQKDLVAEGNILDRNGTMLASTADGSRVFRDNADDRASIVHIIGDRKGQIANSVESFHAGYLYGYQSSLLDAVHNLISKTGRRGNDLTLTIDADLCTDIVRGFSSHDITKGKNGAAAVVNWSTGELLALVSLPSFDPDRVTDEEIESLDQPYWNRATQAVYPPGSTFKIVTAASFLSSSPEAAETTFTCTGSLVVSDSFTVKDFNNASHGALTLRQAFAKSCNSIFASIALNLGDSALRKTAESFGFNENFLFRDLVLYNSSYPRNDQSRDALAASGYGQSAIAVTPLHMCLISAAVANNGVMREPRLLKTVKSSSGSTVLGWSSYDARTVCGAETARTLQIMMKDVVQGGGSGSGAAVAGLDIRGKTGTSESTSGGSRINYGWFTGYNAQSDLPFAVCVLVEDIPDGETGGTTAALIARDIFTYLKNHPDRVL